MHPGPPRKLHYAKYMQTQEFASRLMLVWSAFWISVILIWVKVVLIIAIWHSNYKQEKVT